MFSDANFCKALKKQPDTMCKVSLCFQSEFFKQRFKKCVLGVKIMSILTYFLCQCVSSDILLTFLLITLMCFWQNSLYCHIVVYCNVAVQVSYSSQINLKLAKIISYTVSESKFCCTMLQRNIFLEIYLSDNHLANQVRCW